MWPQDVALRHLTHTTQNCRMNIEEISRIILPISRAEICWLSMMKIWTPFWKFWISVSVLESTALIWLHIWSANRDFFHLITWLYISWRFMAIKSHFIYIFVKRNVALEIIGFIFGLTIMWITWKTEKSLRCMMLRNQIIFENYIKPIIGVADSMILWIKSPTPVRILRPTCSCRRV